MASETNAERAHEEFIIDNRRSAAERCVRQDRHDVAAHRFSLTLGSGTYSVLDYSAFGLAVYSDEPLLVGNMSASLRLGSLVVAEVELVQVRTESRIEGGYKVAFEIKQGALSVNRIDTMLKAQAAIGEHIRFLERDRNVPPAFKRKVYEIKESLERLEQIVNNLQATIPEGSLRELAEFEDSVAQAVVEHLKTLLQHTYAELDRDLDALDETQLKSAYDFFREQLKHLLYQSPLSDRIYTKPLGYAGDYEMMNFIYRNEDVGKSLFAKCLQRFYVAHPSARAVRNRSVYLHERLLRLLAQNPGRPIRILSVASGPAFEIQRLLRSGVDLSNVEIHLLDQDLTALQNAQREIRQLSRELGIEPKVRFIHKAIRNILKDGLEGGYDLVYSAGLFDYFSDPVARLAASRLHKLLAAGGQLVIGNFGAIARDRVLMEMVLDWNLIYRSDADLRRLFDGIGRGIDIEFEPEQINLFVVIDK